MDSVSNQLIRGTQPNDVLQRNNNAKINRNTKEKWKDEQE